MGCTANSPGDSQGQQYLTVKNQAKQSLSFNTVLIFYNELFPLAKDIIQESKSFEDYMKQIDKFSEVIQDFKTIDALASFVQVLSILPTSVKPALQASKPILILTKEESQNFVDKYKPNYEDFTPYFDLLKTIQNSKSKLVDMKLRFQHGKLVIQYGKIISNECFKNNEKIDQEAYEVYTKYVQGIKLIDDITKNVAKINDLLNKDIPFVGKKVKDYLVSGQSNPAVSGTKSAINKIADKIKQYVSKVEDYICKIHIYKFPELQFQQGRLRVNIKKVGDKTDVIKSLPPGFVKEHMK